MRLFGRKDEAMTPDLEAIRQRAEVGSEYGLWSTEDGILARILADLRAVLDMLPQWVSGMPPNDGKDYLVTLHAGVRTLERCVTTLSDVESEELNCIAAHMPMPLPAAPQEEGK